MRTVGPKTFDADMFTWSRPWGPNGPFVGVIEASTLRLRPGQVLNTLAIRGRRETRTFLSVRQRSNNGVIVLEQVGGGGEIHILND